MFRILIALCRKYGKLSIVATQMMASMCENPRPTRAEVSDVATAVILGADAVMLSDETANGNYPIETIKEMKNVILYTQNHYRVDPLTVDTDRDSYDAIANAAVRIADEIDADVIIAATMSGATAEAIAAQRPTMPIVAVTNNDRVAHQLSVRYGVTAYVREVSDSYAFDTAQELKIKGYLKPAEGKDKLKVIVVSGLRSEEGATNSIQIREI